MACLLSAMQLCSLYVFHYLGSLLVLSHNESIGGIDNIRHVIYLVVLNTNVFYHIGRISMSNPSKANTPAYFNSYLKFFWLPLAVYKARSIRGPRTSYAVSLGTSPVLLLYTYGLILKIKTWIKPCLTFRLSLTNMN